MMKRGPSGKPSSKKPPSSDDDNCAVNPNWSQTVQPGADCDDSVWLKWCAKAFPDTTSAYCMGDDRIIWCYGCEAAVKQPSIWPTCLMQEGKDAVCSNCPKACGPHEVAPESKCKEPEGGWKTLKKGPPFGCNNTVVTEWCQATDGSKFHSILGCKNNQYQSEPFCIECPKHLTDPFEFQACFTDEDVAYLCQQYPLACAGRDFPPTPGQLPAPVPFSHSGGGSSPSPSKGEPSPPSSKGGPPPS